MHHQMVERSIILKIIEAGNLAPSGGNSQPWKFIVKDNIIKVIALPEKDHPILNYKNRGTWIAHGALLENMEIAAKNFGIDLDYKIFPENNTSFIIELVESKGIIQENLYEFISKRHSNRKPFEKGLLNEGDKEYLFEEVSKYENLGCEVFYVENEESINKIAENLAKDILINFGNEEMHRLLFKEILFKEKEQLNRGGLYIKTMEVPRVGILLFRLLKNKKILNFFKKKGIINQFYNNSVKTASSCALMCGMFVKNTDESFIYAGKLVENIWLRATKLNLGFHLITGIPFLWQRINFSKDNIFSREEKTLINDAYLNIVREFGVDSDDKILAFVFRIGKSQPPSAVSIKRPPQVEFI
jgi:hypothetical protein